MAGRREKPDRQHRLEESDVGRHALDYGSVEGALHALGGGCAIPTPGDYFRVHRIVVRRDTAVLSNAAVDPHVRFTFGNLKAAEVSRRWQEVPFRTLGVDSAFDSRTARYYGFLGRRCQGSRRDWRSGLWGWACRRLHGDTPALARGPRPILSRPSASAMYSHSRGRVSRGSMISSTANASAVRNGEA